MEEDVLDTGHFDTVAEKVSGFVASPWVFAALAALLAAVKLFRLGTEWLTVVIELSAFAVVVLIHVRSVRLEAAMHKKLNALADGVAELLVHLDEDGSGLADHAERIKEAVGIEDEV
jgi:low affinity Fe/Cu permease